MATPESLQDQGIEFHRINRGGDITYHGPGQLTVYPIFDLEFFFTDVHRYVRSLEQVVINVLLNYGIQGTRRKEYTGVWIDDVKGQRKICAIGVHLSRWTTLHGLAFNVNPDLQHFKLIVPCGISASNGAVTSLVEELGQDVNLDEVERLLKKEFSEVFQFEYLNAED